MSIYFMDGKTFLTDYIDEDPRKVLRTQFVIVSSTIRKTGKWEAQVINANAQLFPSPELILDYDDYKHNEEYWLQYKEQLKESLPLFATLIKYAIEDDALIVLLCAKKEKCYKFFDVMKVFLEEEFGYRIIDYKKLKSGKEKIKKIDETEVLEKCYSILKKAKKRKKERQLSSDRLREQYFKEMDKKTLKKKLKKRGLYEEGMSSSDMRELLDLLI